MSSNNTNGALSTSVLRRIDEFEKQGRRPCYLYIDSISLELLLQEIFGPPPIASEITFCEIYGLQTIICQTERFEVKCED